MRSVRQLAFVSVFVSGIAVLPAGCGGESSAPAATTPQATTAAELGVAECDDYMKKYMACIARMPAAAQNAAKATLDQTRDAWKQTASNEAAKPALAASCRAATETARAAMTAYGCSW
jgi:hypothetical protein